MRPCGCWIKPALHEGHCCFRPESPDDCHDAEGRAMLEAAK